MKFFVDTAEIAEIEDLTSTGLVDGVTTNPSLVAKTGKKVCMLLQVTVDDLDKTLPLRDPPGK